MRLLTRQGDRLICTPNYETPTAPYAILSHTWGPPGDEVLFEELAIAASKTGYRKIDFCLRQAATDGLDYVWIDSCCIDKRNNTELGEAMNRMYQYYASAQVCYVYMADVEGLDDFVRSKWHTRGWTLQELLAPRRLQFYDKSGRFLGDRTTLRAEILEACGIDLAQAVQAVSFTERFRWSLQRQTTKPEDASYCMLGLLEVTMVVNYGIGLDAAREELLRIVGREHGERTVREIRLMLQDKTSRVEPARKLLNALAYEEMAVRRANISPPLDNTCDWLLRQVDYERWIKHGGFLWVKGKPGAGKSTVISFIESQCNTERVIRLSHYFNARGADIEKTSEGLYRALLWQLLFPDTTMQETVAKSWNAMGVSHLQAWSLPTLQRLFQCAVKLVSKPIICYVDALDECTAAQVQDLVDFLIDLRREAATELDICFASRYYPAVVIPESIELCLEAQAEHDRAIAKYVAQRLKVEVMPQAEVLKARIVARADKVFFWVVLIVKILNQEAADGNVHLLQRKLDELPSELNDLLAGIMAYDSEFSATFKASIQWLLFAYEPLSPEAYYFAVLSSITPGSIFKWTSEHQPRASSNFSWTELELLPFESLRRFVSSTSMGFAEVTNIGATVAGKSAHSRTVHRVQFIHLSIRDFFLEHGALQTLFSVSTAPVESWCHNDIRGVCQRYLLQIGSIYEHPLVDYSSSYIVDHAERAAAHVPQDEFVLAHPKTYARRDYSHNSTADHVKVYIASRANRLLATAYRLGQCSQYFEYQAIFDVAARGSEWISTLDTLLQCGVEPNAQDRYGSTAMMHYMRWRSPKDSIERMLELLIRYGADVNVKSRAGDTALTVLCEHEPPYPQELKVMLRGGADALCKNDRGQTAIAILHRGRAALIHEHNSRAMILSLVSWPTASNLYLDRIDGVAIQQNIKMFTEMGQNHYSTSEKTLVSYYEECIELLQEHLQHQNAPA